MERYEIVVRDRPAATGKAAAALARAPYGLERASDPCELVAYSDEHESTLADVTEARIKLLLDVLASRTSALGLREDVDYVLLSERGGGSPTHHPHVLVQGLRRIPALVSRELEEARAYSLANDACLLCDVVGRELAEGLRVIGHTDRFVAYVPFAARAPYEVHVVPLRHARRLVDLTEPERRSLARLTREVVRGFRTLSHGPVPYVLAVHQEPTDGVDWSDVAHLHVEVVPLASAAGDATEIASGAPLNPSQPESDASALRHAVAAARDAEG